MRMSFALDDTRIDARVTWAVITDERIAGQVSERGCGRWTVDSAGMGVRAPRGEFRSRDAAASALVEARRGCINLHPGPTGMLQLVERVLQAERLIGGTPQPGQRERYARELDLSMTQYLMILRNLRSDERAYAFDPHTIERLRDENATAVRRVARLRPAGARTAAVLATAS